MTQLLYSRSLISEPLVWSIRNKNFQHEIKLEELPPEILIQKINSADFDLSIVSPLEFSRLKLPVKIVPDFMISSPISGENCLLFFQDSLNDIKKVYFTENQYAAYEEIMGKILLNEIFELSPEWILKDDIIDVAEDLQKYPVIFQGAEHAIIQANKQVNFLDLTEEWTLQTNLPMIQKLLIVNPEFTKFEVFASLEKSLENGINNLRQIMSYYLNKDDDLHNQIAELLIHNYRYTAADNYAAALEKILHFIYYYKGSDFIPELRYL